MTLLTITLIISPVAEATGVVSHLFSFLRFLRLSPLLQMRMHSPSNTQAQTTAWFQGRLLSWVSPPVTQTVRPSCGSGGQVIGSSMWPRPCAWLWIFAPRRWSWLTAAPASLCRGVAWTAPFTPFMKWPWLSTIAKCWQDVTLSTLGKEGGPRITSARSRTTVSLVRTLSYRCRSEWHGRSSIQLRLPANAEWNRKSRKGSNVAEFSLCWM